MRRRQELRSDDDVARPRWTSGRLNHMRAALLFLTVVLTTTAAVAQDRDHAAAAQDAADSGRVATEHAEETVELPVSVDHIRQALEQQPAKPLFAALPSDQPTFRIDVKERSRLQELVATLDFKAGPVPAGGIYSDEQQRVLWPATNYPLRQPYAAFSQPELLTVVGENLAGKYLVGKALGAATSADRARADVSAHEEVRRAIGDYCASQPNGGSGIAICATPTQ